MYFLFCKYTFFRVGVNGRSIKVQGNQGKDVINGKLVLDYTLKRSFLDFPNSFLKRKYKITVIRCIAKKKDIGIFKLPK